jgi:tetratricopeptide (TPR) repeat protein
MLVAAWSSQRRALTIVLALLCAGLPWLQPRLAFASLSPWSPRPVVPEFLWSTPEGLLAVEPGRGERSLVTLDRRRLTPTHDEEAADGLALETSFSLIPAEKRAGTVRTLFVGQLTPARARTLARLGQLDLERTAPWHAAMPLIEPYLFAGEGEPPGRILPPAAARARLSEGAYDWVIAAGIRGPIVSWRSEANELWSEVDAPRLTDLELPAGTVGTSWTPMNARVAQGVELGQMLVAFGALDQPAFGLARGEFGELALPLFELERWDGPCPLTQLVTLPQLRAFEFERAFSAGLVSRSSPPFARGLALHFAAQVLSSPYETRAQQIELEEEALRAFREAVPPPGALDPLTRALWEALAWLCLEKRQPEFALVYLEPVADRFRPWPALERSLARAFLEVLEPETALAYAERALVALPEDFELLIDAARAGLELGGRERAAPFLERALALEPTREDRVRTLGFLLHEAGDGRGRALLEALLQRHPEDEELLRVLASGPTPP